MTKADHQKGIVCNRCKNVSLPVIYTRKRDGKIIRLRECSECKQRLLTIERSMGEVTTLKPGTKKLRKT
jgi:transcriptional regulator NrdR family protein